MAPKELSPDSDVRTQAYIKSTRLFFISSKLFIAQITDIFDRLWPTLTALKMLRWQVRGYYEELGIGKNEALTKRFVDSIDKTWRPNLYRTCIKQTWSDTEYSVACDLLVNLFARYEGWCENILRELGYTQERQIKTDSKKLQFPGKFLIFLNNLKNGADPVIASSFYNLYAINNKRYNLAHLDNYLEYYRFFKECRNSIAHKGETTSQEIINAHQAIVGISMADLDVEELPETPCNVINQPLQLSLRGVVGFSQILLNIVSTMDIELIQAAHAKEYMISQLKIYNPEKPNFVGINNIGKKIKSMYQKSHFQPPHNALGLYNTLKTQKLML